MATLPLICRLQCHQLCVSYYATDIHRRPGSFCPAPKVTSAVVRMLEITPPAATVRVEDEEELLCPCARGAGQRRKTAANAIASGLGMPKDAVTAAIEAAGFDAHPSRPGCTLEVAKIQNTLAR